jgi:hypothetical protein
MNELIPPKPDTIWNWIVSKWPYITTGLLSLGTFLWIVFKEWIVSELGQKLFGRSKAIQNEKEQIVKLADFDAFKSTTAARLGEMATTTASRLDQLGSIVADAAFQMSDTAKETRETLRLFDLKNEEHTKDLHEKINDTNMKVSELTGAVNTFIDLKKKGII